MTRKDFVLIAETIKESRLTQEDKAVIARAFLGPLGGTNPGFRPVTFLNACGIINEMIP